MSRVYEVVSVFATEEDERNLMLLKLSHFLRKLALQLINRPAASTGGVLWIAERF